MSPSARLSKPRFGRYALVFLYVATSLVLIAVPLVRELRGPPGKYDYPLWRWAGGQVLAGGDLYPADPHAWFAFLYPPFAAVLLAPLSLYGVAFLMLCIGLAYAASFGIAVKLSNRLAGESGAKPLWMMALPAALALPVIWENFNYGQPNLMLLAIMLAGLALLSAGRQVSAGATFAFAAALKAFPIAVLPYLLWRRRWRAAAGMVIFIAIFLLVVPAPFRGFERNLNETRTWFNAMALSANSDGFGQRPEQNWSWKNNSLVAVTHRLLRPLNAEALDPAAKPFTVNLFDLNYEQANLVLLAIAGLIGLGFVAAMPPERRRTLKSDAAEYGVLISLMTISSPLARDYYFVWMLFPVTVLTYRAATDSSVKARAIGWSLLALAMGLFALRAPHPPPHWPQAYGSDLWASAVIIGALVWRMHRDAKAVETSLLPAPAAD
ncbi:MAG: DUF2029 domain-containing protein [Bradyrhizobium sp.]|nr:MAG: DUF2029 domain-containing protein [Bradyrhizobium sp.]